ncbi:hypothetical protein AWC38_SpisGene21679 [Stylophora pistillata]|uniref:FP protein C-terminal domain-containing protein n=1 Tax=Stylophora pistillata TaxID=50429 RepID=A0A2B4RBK1_STYPI|nr:hypothetical protein AWC38_SpisGene21679 [Stylophora pistillata]
MSSSRNSKDVEDSPDEGVFEELHKHINDVHDLLKRETNKLRKEKEAFDEVAKKLEHVHFSKMLKLNVGGHMFATSLETMTKDQVPSTNYDPLNSTISELKKSIKEAMSFLEFVNEKYDELLEVMKSSKEERKALKDDNKILHDENKILKATIRSIESSLESITRANKDHYDLEQYTCRECVEIQGIAVAATPSEEQTNNAVTDVDKLLGMDITQNDISVIHRMPQSRKRKGKPGPPAIIVKFTRRDVKDNFYHARKQLKDLTTRDLGYSEKNKIYIAESLTERNRMLFKDCLKVKKDMEFKFIWTLNGKIFMEKSS